MWNKNCKQWSLKRLCEKNDSYESYQWRNNCYVTRSNMFDNLQALFELAGFRIFRISRISRSSTWFWNRFRCSRNGCRFMKLVRTGYNRFFCQRDTGRCLRRDSRWFFRNKFVACPRSAAAGLRRWRNWS